MSVAEAVLAVAYCLVHDLVWLLDEDLADRLMPGC